MTKLEVVIQSWNKEKIVFYKPVIDILKENNINKVEELLQVDIQLLCNMTKITKQVPPPNSLVKAFKQDVMYSVPIEEDLVNLRKYPITTGFKDLDTCTNQIIELCGTTNNRGKSNFISSLLSSFIRDYNKEDIYVYDTSGIFFERMISDNSELSHIACTQLVDLDHFLSAMENVSTLLVYHERPSLVLIDDISNFIMNWNQNIVHVVNTFKSLSRLNCIVILLHNHHTNFTLKKYELDWNPMIDTRLLFTIQNGDDKVEIIKSRQRVMNTHTN